MPASPSPRRAKKRAARTRADRDLIRSYSRAQFVAKLRRFADAIEANRPFVIQVASERLRIPANVRFNIEHERAAATDELEFQVFWSVDEPAPNTTPRKTRKRR